MAGRKVAPIPKGFQTPRLESLGSKSAVAPRTVRSSPSFEWPHDAQGPHGGKYTPSLSTVQFTPREAEGSQGGGLPQPMARELFKGDENKSKESATAPTEPDTDEPPAKRTKSDGYDKYYHKFRDYYSMGVALTCFFLSPPLHPIALLDAKGLALRPTQGKGQGGPCIAGGSANVEDTRGEPLVLLYIFYLIIHPFLMCDLNTASDYS